MTFFEENFVDVRRLISFPIVIVLARESQCYVGDVVLGIYKVVGFLALCVQSALDKLETYLENKQRTA